MEYRVLDRSADPEARGDERVHLARLDTSRSVCGHVSFDGSPFDPWQLREEEVGPEDVDGANRCLACWERWEAEHRADRERRGQYVPPERTHVRAKRRHVSPQVRTQRIATAAAKRAPAAGQSADGLFRMYRADLERLGTPEAVAELERRAAKRAAKRAERVAA